MTKRSVICPECQRPATFTVTRWGMRYDCRDCGLRGYDGRVLVDKGTRLMRQRAHECLDLLWRSGLASRSDVYRTLAELMGLTSEQCHIALMNKAQCANVVALSREMRLPGRLP